MGQMPFAVADQVQGFGAGVLGSVAADGPLAGNAGMEQRTAAVGTAQAGMARNIAIDQQRIHVDGGIRFGVADDDDIRRDGVVAAQCGGQGRVGPCSLVQRDQMGELLVFGNFETVAPGDLMDIPQPRA